MNLEVQELARHLIMSVAVSFLLSLAAWLWRRACNKRKGHDEALVDAKKMVRGKTVDGPVMSIGNDLGDYVVRGVPGWCTSFKLSAELDSMIIFELFGNGRHEAWYAAFSSAKHVFPNPEHKIVTEKHGGTEHRKKD